MSQPNILLILIDDLGWADLGVYGSSFYETPNLDRMAAEGVRFTDAYASAPVCSPTRAAIMSGKYPARVGITQFIGGHEVGQLCDVPYFHGLPMSEYSVASALRDGGYATWHVGKWHLGASRMVPEHHGFDVNYGGGAAGMPAKGYFSPWKLPALDEAEPGKYLTDHLTDLAIDLIRSKPAEKPFFLNYWAYSVHTPIQAPAELVAKYEQKARDLGLDQQKTFEEGEPMAVVGLRGRNVRRRLLQSDPTYAAMIENLDTNLGRLFKALDETGQADNTLVIFTSDNGGLSTSEGSPTCNHPLAEGKGWMYEGGNRVCQIARWPAVIAPGTVSSVPVTSTDLYPTFLEAAGLDLHPEQHCDGVSLMPLLQGSDALERDAIFWHYPHYSNQGGRPACSIRAGRYKLIEFFEDGHLELYDLEADISETHNLASEQPIVTHALHLRLLDWRRGIQALVPQRNVKFAMEAPM